MKGLIHLFTVFFITLGTCYPCTIWNKQHEISIQLSSLVDYPDILGEKGGIVVIQFFVGESNAIGRVKVFTSDEELNNDLIRQLTGKRIQFPDYHRARSYTVKLRFIRVK